MRKFKIGSFISLLIILSYLILEYFLFTHAKYDFENNAAEIRIHFIHGSFPKKNCTDQRIRVGGLLGGHIEIEIDQFVYGFEFENPQDIHIFPRRDPGSYNSIFTMKEKANWLTETRLDKITSIRIPVAEKQKKELANKLKTAYQNPPYDYSFFGMRCASSSYEDISTLGILPKKSRIQYIINAFYPRQLRKRMVGWAEYNKLNLEFKKGIDCRVWE